MGGVLHNLHHRRHPPPPDARYLPQVYLVGDPVQLPATVIATRAVEQGYDCSLFKRLQVGI